MHELDMITDDHDMHEETNIQNAPKMLPKITIISSGKAWLWTQTSSVHTHTYPLD